MIKIQILLVLVTLFMSSCSTSFQYDVYVKNSTGMDIIVDYKSMKDKRGPIESSILVRNGESKQIISTVDLAWHKSGLMATPEQCHQVAEYVLAKLEETESKLKWCDDRIHFSEEDLGQGRFTIEYHRSDF